MFYIRTYSCFALCILFVSLSYHLFFILSSGLLFFIRTYALLECLMPLVYHLFFILSSVLFYFLIRCLACLLAVPYAFTICHAVLSCQVFFMIIFCDRLYALCGVGFPALCWLWCRCGLGSGALICPKVLPELR